LSQRRLENPGHFQLRHAGFHQADRELEGALGGLHGQADLRDFVLVFSFAQGLHEIQRRPPLEACSRLEQALKIAVHQVRGLEARDFQLSDLGVTNSSALDPEKPLR
jgi:hypothetical protein